MPCSKSSNRCANKSARVIRLPGEQRRAEELERRLHADEHGAEVRERREQDRAEDREDEEYRSRHRH